MAWSSSDRHDRLPADWPKLRSVTKRLAGGRCEHVSEDGTRCSAVGAQCDHIVNNDDHTQGNLQWLCRPHHDEKTRAEAAAGYARMNARRYHPREQHPGMA